MTLEKEFEKIVYISIKEYTHINSNRIKYTIKYVDICNLPSTYDKVSETTSYFLVTILVTVATL